jgi:acetyl-CoA acetyltransferase
VKENRNKVAIVGVAYSPVAVNSTRSLGALTVEACLAAIEDAGLRVEDIDGISNYPAASRIGGGDQDGIDIVSIKFMAEALKLTNLRWSCSISTGTIGASLVHAAAAVASGACTTALVWRSMYNPPGKFGSYQATHASGESQFAAPYGFANNVMLYAWPYSQYMAEYGATREHMATYVVNSRQNASINPNAIFFGKPIERADYMAARMIAEPYCLLDCDRPIDGCSALIVTTLDRARDLRRPPVHVVGGATGGLKYDHSPIWSLESARKGAAIAANAVWKNTGLGPKDIDFVNIYDGFSFFIYMWLEAFGFCPLGEAFRFIQDGRIALDGELPVNPSGGAIGMGRLHGGPQLIEAVLQIQRRAGERQLAKTDITLAQSGGPTGNGAVVLSKDRI